MDEYFFGYWDAIKDVEKIAARAPCPPPMKRYYNKCMGRYNDPEYCARVSKDIYYSYRGRRKAPTPFSGLARTGGRTMPILAKPRRR